MKTLLAGLSFSVLLSLSSAHAADAPQSAEPNQQTEFMLITREYVKPGQMSAVVQADRERAQALRKAHWPRAILGFKSITGTDQVVYLSFYSDLGPLQTEREALDKNATVQSSLRQAGENMVKREDILVKYHPDISYRPQWNWAKTRCLDMIHITTQAGKGALWIENRQLTLQSHEQGGLPTHLFIYATFSGPPSWTFWVVRPMPSLGFMDDLAKQGFGEPFTPELKKRQVELFAESAASERERYLCADPSISYVPASWAGADNSYWNGK